MRSRHVNSNIPIASRGFANYNSLGLANEKGMLVRNPTKISIHTYFGYSYITKI